MSAACDDIQVDQLLDAVYRVLEVGGFSADRLHGMLRLMYRVGWGVGFDQGFEEGIADAAEKRNCQKDNQ